MLRRCKRNFFLTRYRYRDIKNLIKFEKAQKSKFLQRSSIPLNVMLCTTSNVSQQHLKNINNLNLHQSFCNKFSSLVYTSRAQSVMEVETSCAVSVWCSLCVESFLFTVSRQKRHKLLFLKCCFTIYELGGGE
jgi:hypothetical protein